MTSFWLILRQICIALIAWLVIRLNLVGKVDPESTGTLLAMIVVTVLSTLLETHAPKLLARLKGESDPKPPTGGTP